MTDVTIQEYKGDPDKFMFIGQLSEESIYKVIRYAESLVGEED